MMKVAAVSHADVDAGTTSSGNAPQPQANRTLAVLSKMFSLAIAGAGAATTRARASSATRRTSGPAT